MKLRNLLPYMLLLLSMTVSSQNPSFWNITDEDGLPSMTIYQMIQDDAGMIWLATANGLAKYDGYSFETYYNDNQEDNEIMDLDIDSQGRIWYSNLSRQLFVVENEVAHEIDVLLNKEISKIYDFEIVNDVLWFRDELHDLKKREIGWFDISNNLNDLRPNAFKNLFDSKMTKLLKVNDGIEFGIGNSIYRIDNDAKDTVVELIKSDHVTPAVNLISKNNNQFYLQVPNEISDQELVEFFPKEGIVNYKYKEDYHSLHFIEDEIWVLTSDGVLLKDKNNINSRNVFQGYYCNDILYDNEENIWISTDGDGVLFIPNRFVVIYNKESNSLPTDFVSRLFVDNNRNRMFLGMGEGHVNFLNDDFTQQSLELESNERNRDILIDEEGNYIFVMNTNLLLYDKNFTQIDKKYISAVKAIFVDDSGFIWLGSSRGYGRFENWDSLTSVTEKLGRTYTFFEDYEKRMWVGTIAGLNSFKETHSTIGENGSQYKFDVRSIVQTKDSVLWLATQGDGVIKIKNNEIVGSITTDNGISNNSCNKLMLHKDRLWVGTKNGLNLIDLKTNKIEQINHTDGLPSNEINDLAIFNNHVWVGTPKGLASFSENLDFMNLVEPMISISKVKILESDTAQVQNMRLKYNQNHLQFEFLGVGFRSRQDLSYQYRLSGINSDWVSTESRIARFPSLPHGEYLFEVRAFNEDGIVSKKNASFNFEIIAPWWKTLWFICLSIFILFGVTGFLFYNRFRNIRKRELKEQLFKDKVIELKGQALQSQMNPHFVFNCLNSILHLLAINDQEKAMIYLSKFAKLIRQIFSLSGKKLIDIEEEIDFLKSYLELEELRFGDKVVIEFNIDDGLQSELSDIRIPPLLIQPIIENSFKHGLFHKNGEGFLSVDFSFKNKIMHCSVEDNGVGREKTKSINAAREIDHSSNGLQVVTERLNLHNRLKSSEVLSEFMIKDLYDDKGNSVGTKVILQIKY